MTYTVKVTHTFEKEIDVCANSPDEALDVVDIILGRTNLLDVEPIEGMECRFGTSLESVSEDDTDSLYRQEGYSDDEEDEFDEEEDEDNEDESDNEGLKSPPCLTDLFFELYDQLYETLYDELYDELHNDIWGGILSVPSQTINSLMKHALNHPLEGE